MNRPPPDRAYQRLLVSRISGFQISVAMIRGNIAIPDVDPKRAGAAAVRKKPAADIPTVITGVRSPTEIDKESVAPSCHGVSGRVGVTDSLPTAAARYGPTGCASLSGAKPATTRRRPTCRRPRRGERRLQTTPTPPREPVWPCSTTRRMPKQVEQGRRVPHVDHGCHDSCCMGGIRKWHTFPIACCRHCS
jgi:hypothetical protein